MFFSQVKLDKSSSYLSTCSTTFWHIEVAQDATRKIVCFRGVSGASKESIDGLRRVDVIAYDILCYGCCETMEQAIHYHDVNLRFLIDRAGEANWNSAVIIIFK